MTKHPETMLLENLLLANQNSSRRGFLHGLLVGAGVMILEPSLAEASRGRCNSRYDLIFGPDHSVDPISLVGQPAPPFVQEDVNPSSSSFGNYVGPQDYIGKVVVVNFGDFSLCQPCREEMPNFQRAYQDHDIAVLFF